jgi:amino acid transporter
LSADQPPADRSSRFVRALGTGDVVLMTVTATVGLQFMARGARAGAPALVLWLAAALVFLVPHALCVAELTGRVAEQGGVYAWVRRAYGPFHGFVAGWCLWINNVFFLPAVLLFAAPSLLAVLGPGYAPLAEDRAYSALFVLAALWVCIGANILGLGVARWLPNVASVGVWGVTALLIGLGIYGALSGRSATAFNLSAPWPDSLGALGLLSAMCFAFSGYEAVGTVREEVRDPVRTLPRGLFLAGAAAFAIYLGGSAAILVALPAASLSERSTIPEAIDLMGRRLGVAGLAPAASACVVLAAVALAASWVACSSRVPFAAADDRALPAALARLHPRYRTPYVSLVVQGVVASVLFLAVLFVNLGGGTTTVADAYDILVNLTILICFVPYLYAFPALATLRRLDAGGRVGFRVPGGRTGLALTVTAGLVATAGSMALVFVPPPGTANPWNYEANVLLQTAIVLCAGLALFRWSRRRAASPADVQRRVAP